ncbi:MAG TPA: diaminopimelate decarboxylase, partial [Anaerolineales bacterium]|nr:diaminopimelate decarboxylase [Anaerolineales bacterium]
QKHYPADAHVTYAGKAFFCKAVAEWIHRQGLWADCTGEGEIRMALMGGLRRESIVAHGVNKSSDDLLAALQHAGTVVADNLTELRKISALRQANPGGTLPDIWLRLLPGVAVATHHVHTQTGQHGSKFGMTPEELVEAVRFCRQQDLPVSGLHFHQGSNFRDPAPLVSAIRLAVELTSEIALGNQWHLCPGGGWSVAYHESELPQPDMDAYVRVISQTITRSCKDSGLPLPYLHIEPGRSLIARAGVALYRVGTVKRRPEGTWILVDGGMADNPRHALYGSRYSCLPVTHPEREPNEPVSIAGPFCESGDVLIEGLPLPRLDEADLLAIPASGAYQLSMSSNYNGARRPAVVWIARGRARLVIRRETFADLSDRDLSLS